jgi:hypothetical protein
MDVDEDDEDMEALRALTGKAGAAAPSGAAEEARVSILSQIMDEVASVWFNRSACSRASNAQSVVKYLRTLP